MAKPYSNGSNVHSAVRQDVERMLSESQSFRHLDEPTQHALTDALSKITGYLASSNIDPNLANPMATELRSANNLQEQLAPQGPPGRPMVPGQALPAQGPAPNSVTAPTSQSTIDKTGGAAKALLNAIDFPQFVASLIQGTFQAIVDSSIQQMEAYAQLLKNVARTVDQFMSDNISDPTARDYLADQYDGILARDTTGGTARLRVREDRGDAELPSFFKDLGFGSVDEIDDDALEEKVIPAARRNLAEQRQQTLATMVLMGINRVVVDGGEISAKLVFHIDASESTQIRFNQSKTTGGNIFSQAGRSPFNANAILVNTASLNAQSDINIRADMTGQVKVRFRSETFPLERFADSMAIQLINQNAKVPQPLPSPGAAPTNSAQAPAPAGTVPQQAQAPQTPSVQPPPTRRASNVAVQAEGPNTVSTQSLDSQADPWAPTTGAAYDVE